MQIDKFKTPNYDIYLTKTQINQIGIGKRVTINKTQLKKNGGFLPFLISLWTLLGLVPATGVSSWTSKIVLDKITGEWIRHPFENKQRSGLEKNLMERSNNKM